jgi:DNA-binding MarR family transcriptional regulator
VTGVLDRLERSGHVIRIRDLGDRRAVRLELSESGRRLVRDVGRSLQRHVSELVGGVPMGKRNELTALLDEMEQAIQRAPPR